MALSVLKLAAAAGLLAAGAAAETPLRETRSQLEKWVETRQLISQTRGGWQADKETIDQTIQLFERELRTVEAQRAGLSTNQAQVEKERLEAEAVKRSAGEGLERARQFAGEFEGRLRTLVPQLPPPLQDLLKPLLNRLPADSNTRMSVAGRVQVIVGMLNEIDKFNGSVSVFSERRGNPNAGEVAVETIYIGLGAAYFVNEAGDFAGVGTFRGGAWEWTPRPELAPAIREAVRIYRNERAARFVSLPVVIQ
jgi:hypothetical protein